MTAAFLYGAAIWPIFLTQRHGDDLVRAILERGGADQRSGAGRRTDVVLQSMQTSMAVELPLFSASMRPPTRAGSDGYTNAASYPMVSLAELGASAAGTTYGFASLLV